MHWLLRDWLSLKVQGPIFSGKASRDTLICGGVVVIADIFVLPVVEGCVETGFFFVGIGLIGRGEVFLTILLGLALEGWSTFFFAGLEAGVTFFVFDVLDGGVVGTYGVGTITRGATLVVAGRGGGVLVCVSVIEGRDWWAFVGCC